jgi:excinuclease ABC subunit C
VATICTEERYGVAVADTRMFLEGRNEELVTQLRERMKQAAAEERYEEAAQLRDAIRTVESVKERQQKMATAGLNDRDVIGLRIGPRGAVVQVFVFREGRVIERFELQTEDASQVSEADFLEVTLQQLYTDTVPPPAIHVAIDPTDCDVLEEWLSSRAARRVRIVVPRRGDTKDMVALAQRNAALAYRSRFETEATAQYDALESLRAILKLPAMPRRIECFDISTIQGSETVAAMVVCEDGRMKKSDYRKFRIRCEETAVRGRHSETGTVPRRHAETGTVPGPPRFLDDFAAMKQVVERRYRRVLDQGGPFPDLLMIDGGKGQLNAAYEALETVGLSNLIAIGLAKREELVFVRDSDQPLAMDPHGAPLRLLQRIRDEAHRFAVTFHRQSRTRRDLRSELDAVPGIGPRRRKALLTQFGSLAGVRRATREELTRVVGAKGASAIINHFAHTS